MPTEKQRKSVSPEATEFFNADWKTTGGDARLMLLIVYARIYGERELLVRRIAALEDQQKAMGYRGVWKQSTVYARGSFVTCGGSMWAALEDTDTKPGTDCTWQLAVKKGRDAKRERERQKSLGI